MANKRTSDPLLLCDGKGCAKKRGAEWASLAHAATEARIPVVTTSCLGSCEGPTAIVNVDGDPRIFERLCSTGARADLISLARNTATPVALPARLQKRELTGKRRKKALKRLEAR